MTSTPLTLASLFTPEPMPWGLRGDPHLWREMAEHFQTTPLPATEAEVVAAIEAKFLELTGHPVSHPAFIFIQRHAHGGMSSGGIAPVFWRERGIPHLLANFKALTQTG